MKKTIILYGFLLSSVLAQTNQQTSSIEIRKLMDAVEERHDAAEDAIATAFKLMNDYHNSVMASSDVVIYSGANSYLSYPSIAYRDDFVDYLRAPRFEFDLIEDDYEIPAPEKRYFYAIHGLNAQQDAAAQEYAENSRANDLEYWENILDAARDSEYQPRQGNQYNETATSEARDPIGYQKARWEEWVAYRKIAIEDAVKPPAFTNFNANNYEEYPRITPPPNPDIALRNQKHKDAWEEERLRKIARAERAIEAIGDLYEIDLTGDEESDEIAQEEADAVSEQYLDDLGAWQGNKSDWYEEQRNEAANDYMEKAAGFASQLQTRLNSERVKKAFAKYTYLTSVDLGSSISHYTCSAEFEKSSIKWSVNSPSGFGEELVALNEISRHLERIAGSYSHLANTQGGGVLESRSITQIFNQSFEPVGIVTKENYISKIAEIKRLIRRMDTLYWPMLNRHYYTEMSIPASEVNNSQGVWDIGENATENSFVGGNLSEFGYMASNNLSLSAPGFSSTVPWHKKILWGVLQSDDLDSYALYGFGSMYDISTSKGEFNGKLFLLSNSYNNSVRQDVTSDFPSNGKYTKTEFQTEPTDLGGNFFNYKVTLENVPPDEDYDPELSPQSSNTIAKADYILRHISFKKGREYSIALDELGLPGTIKISATPESTESDFFLFKLNGAIKSQLPSSQISSSPQNTLDHGYVGTSSMVFQPEFEHIPDEAPISNVLSFPEVGFSVKRLNSDLALEIPLPFLKSSSAENTSLILPLIEHGFDGRILSYLSRTKQLETYSHEYTHGFWGFMKLQGDLSDVTIETRDSPNITSYLWDDFSTLGEHEISPYMAEGLNTRMATIKSIKGSNGRLDIEWLGHYHFKLNYYYNGSANPIASYEIFAGGTTSGGQLIEQEVPQYIFDPETFAYVDTVYTKYPEHFERVTIKKNDVLMAEAILIEPSTLSTAEESEYARLRLYDDSGELVSTEYIFDEFDFYSPFQDEFTFSTKIVYPAGGEVTKQYTYANFRAEGLPNTNEDIIQTSHENRLIGYEFYSPSIYSGDILWDGFPGIGLKESPVIVYLNQEGEDSEDWTHLPLYRYPMKRTLMGTGWTQNGEIYEYEQDGTLKSHTYKTGGLNAKRVIVMEEEEDEVTYLDQTTIDDLLMSTTATSYPEGLAKVVTESAGVSSTIEYYTSNADGGEPWFPKKITNDSGVTNFTYERKSDGGFKTTTTFHPVGDDSNVVTTTDLNKYGELLSEIVKSGETKVSEVVATGHASTPLGKPTQIVTTSGGVTRTLTYEYHPDGTVKKTNDGNGTVNEYEWDVLGRMKDGTKLDGLDVEPEYNGFKNEIDYGGDVIKSETDAYGRTMKYEDPRGAGLELTRTADFSFDTKVTNEGNRGFSQTSLPDGASADASGGLGSPGGTLEYDVDTVNGINCIKVKSTVVSGSTETDVVTTSFYDGYGRIVRYQEPHPMGTGVVNTDYAYDISARKVTISPPAPSKNVVMQFAPGWKNPVVTQGGRQISLTTTVTGGTVNEVVKNAGREVYSKSTSLTSGQSETKTNRRNAIKTTPSADGNTVNIEGPRNLDINLISDRFGLKEMNGSIAEESFDTDIDRNNKGEVNTITSDPPGPRGSLEYTIGETGRIEGVTGPGINLDLSYNFANGGMQVSGNDQATNKNFLASSDADGNPRKREATGRDSLQFGGSAYEGSMTMSAAGFPGQVNYSIGPTGLPLGITRADGSGMSYQWHADSSLNSYTRFDGQANGGGSNTFVMSTDSDTGFSTGFTGDDCSLQLVPNADGTIAASQFTFKDVDDETKVHTTQYPAYFDDSPLVESFSGVLGGYQVRRNYNEVTGETTRLELWKDNALVHAVDYTGDGRSQIGTVTASAGKNFTATYAYPNQLMETLTAGSVVATKTFSGDGTGRLTSLGTSAGGNNYSASFGYAGGFNRKSMTLDMPGEAPLVWNYVFENAQAATGQLQSASSSAGTSYTYQHDAAGNRAGTNPNHANQYSISQVAGSRTYTVTGKVAPGATVTITRAGGAPEPVVVAADGSFSKTYPAPLGGQNPMSIPLVVEGTLAGAGDNGTDAVAAEEKTIVLAPSSWPSTYGAHGALAADWRWAYQWDCLGRLYGMDTQAAAVNAGMPNLKLKFSYDHEGRRISKTAIHRNANGAVERTVNTRFIYDGWLLLAEEIDDSAAAGPVLRTYTWGKDIAGGLEETGGVGGLLAIHENGASRMPIYDANGNIIALANASTGATVATWQRGPFGEMISSTGDTSLCPFGFATHYTDEETGLVYFGHRFYSPETGRWLSREPLGEMESFNLYAYCHNDPINKIDVRGLAEVLVSQADNKLIDLALRYGLLNEDSGPFSVIDTAVINQFINSEGGHPIEFKAGRTVHPCTICHGRSASGRIAGISPLYSMVNGEVFSSTGNGDMMRKIGAGAWGSIRALPADIGNSAGFMVNAVGNAVFDTGTLASSYEMPFEADYWRNVGQEQVYPGIKSDNLLVRAGNGMPGALTLVIGPEYLLTKAPGWAARLMPSSKLSSLVSKSDNFLFLIDDAAKTPLARLQGSFDDLAEQHLLPQFRAIDPNLKAGYTGSFRTGTVGNPSKATFGQPIDLNKFDIDYWIESDVLFKKFGPNLRANPEFRKILSETPGFEGLKANKEGFSIKFKPSGS